MGNAEYMGHSDITSAARRDKPPVSLARPLLCFAMVSPSAVAHNRNQKRVYAGRAAALVLNPVLCGATHRREHTPSRAERRTVEPAQPDQGAAVWPDSEIQVFVRFHKKISHIQQDTGFNDEPAT